MTCQAKTFECLVHQRYINVPGALYAGELCEGCSWWHNPDNKMPASFTLEGRTFDYPRLGQEAWMRRP